MYYMANKIRLLLLTTSCIGVLSVLYVQITNANDLTSIQELFFVILFFIPILIIINVLLKYCVCMNIHTDTYNANLKHNVLVFIFKVELIIFIISTAANYANLYNTISKFETLSCIIGMLISWTLEQMISLNDQNKESVLNIDSLRGLDYGTAMAYSYFYGYLKIILPTTGSLNKGIIEKLENVEDNHNIHIATHKLLILIPASSYIPPDLKEVSFQWIESAIELEPEIRDRAGVKRRSYHNNIYKIYPNGDRSNSIPVYVVAEGATPLLTYFEVQKHTHPETNTYWKYRRDVIRNFYNKLNELISNDPECMDLCELIYYNDYDSNGRKVNVAEVILDRLNKNQENMHNTNRSL
ncbi:transmembrane protein sting [Megachile rotundata]|uniref:transmembrane protein sting n=1 Tax=Megachile rotundata TaxID=143995 RepID=UPI000614A7C0|nr:PREDICTED: stimulator of interferon genes protein [Megachile rotundata]